MSCGRATAVFEAGHGADLALAIAGLVAFGQRIAVEDAALTDRFGDQHRAYRKRKAALIPLVW